MERLSGRFLPGKGERMIFLDNSTGIEKGRIVSFDYERLLSNLETPLELRKIDYRK